MVTDYKIMAIEQQRSQRLNQRHVEKKKQEQARQLVIRLRRERRVAEDRHRQKVQENLERNMLRLQMKEADLEIKRAKL